jgi:hypothetical protein
MAIKNEIINSDPSCCWVCGIRFTTSQPPGPGNCEEHHVFPQNAGGTDGPLVRLCDTDHTKAHKLALSLHKKKIASEYLIGASEEGKKKLMWLAAMIVKAEKATENDPNKVWKNPVNLEGQAPEAMRRLRAINPKLSKAAIVELALLKLLKSYQ